MFNWFKSDDDKKEAKKKKAQEATSNNDSNNDAQDNTDGNPKSENAGTQGNDMNANINLKEMKITEGEQLLDVLIQIVREIDDGSDGTHPMNVYVKLNAFNKNIKTRIEKNVTKVSDVIFNQHLIIESSEVTSKSLEGSPMILRVMKDTTLISEFSLDLLNIYQQSGHAMTHKWLAMVDPKNEPTKIRSLMKVSVQLVGPNDEQQKMNTDMSDFRSSTTKLMLPPQLNPQVWQQSIKVFRGRDMDINTSFLGFFTDTIDPQVRVTLGEQHMDTDHKDNDTTPEWNQNIYLPCNIPSMVQHIKFELYTKKTVKDILLATEQVPIHFLDSKKLWGQQQWINFFTSCNVESSIGRKMVEGILEGNQFGGQLLVKIERKETKNPEPIKALQLLFDRSAETDLTEEEKKKAKLMARLNKTAEKKSNKKLEAQEKQPEKLTQKLKVQFEIYMCCNMPNDKSGNQEIDVSCGRERFFTLKPKKHNRSNDYQFQEKAEKEFTFDQIKGTTDSAEVWLFQMPDIVITYFVSGKVVSYLKLVPHDLYFRKGIMAGTELRVELWNKYESEGKLNDEVLSMFFPKMYEMNYDPTCPATGCFEERPGYIQFNMNLQDLGLKSRPVPGRNDMPHNMLSWINNNQLDPIPQEYKLFCYLFQCNNLPPGDSDGLSDPQVRMFYAFKEKKSETHNKTLNPQFQECHQFEVEVFRCKWPGEEGVIHRMTPPMFLEIWDSDKEIFDRTDDILGAVKMDLQDHDQHKGNINMTHKLEKLKKDIVTEQNSHRREIIEADIEKMENELNKRRATKPCYAYDDKKSKDHDPRHHHDRYKPQIFPVKDFIRGQDSSAAIQVKNVFVPIKQAHEEVQFFPEYCNYSMEFQCVGFRNLINHGIIPVKQPYLHLRLKDLLPKEYKIMTKDIDTINSKGLYSNKSLYTIINTNLKLPKDVYLFPTLGVNVNDSFLGVFSFGNCTWGNFDIDLKKHETHQLLQAEQDNQTALKRSMAISHMAEEIKKKTKFKSAFSEKQEQLMLEAQEVKFFRPQRKVGGPSAALVNDVQVRKRKKRSVKFNDNDIQLPSLMEAIQGKIKIMPIWKKEGNVWIEMTQYPTESTEPLGQGYENKHYRHVLRQAETKISKDKKGNAKSFLKFADTPYGNKLALEYATIYGYDNGKSQDIGQFVYYCTIHREVGESEKKQLTKEEQEWMEKEKKQMDNLKKSMIMTISNNQEYDIRLQVLRGLDIARKDEDSESDPYLVIFTEKFYQNGQAEQLEDDSNPKFQKMFRFRAKIPEENTLTVQVWDKDFLCDEMIGQFQISLLERVLSPNYMSIKHKPVEDRDIRDDISPHSKGRLRYILEIYKTTEEVKDPIRMQEAAKTAKTGGSIRNSILSKLNFAEPKASKADEADPLLSLLNPSDKSMKQKIQFTTVGEPTNIVEEIMKTAESKKDKKSKSKALTDPNGNKTHHKPLSEEDILKKNPLINISRIPPRKFNVRVVIWSGECIPAMDMGGTSDVQVKGWLRNQYMSKVVETEMQSTDIHWANSNGQPNWNWRMEFDYLISDEEEMHSIHFQAFDKDILSQDEMIGAADLDFTGLAKFSYMENIRQQAKVVPHEQDEDAQRLERVKQAGEGGEKMEIQLQNANKNGNKEQRGSLQVDFTIVPEEAAKQMQVGRGRSEPNVDPFLPEPAGRLSLFSGPWASFLGGFFVLAGPLKEYLLKLLLIVTVVAMIIIFVQGLITSFSGTFITMLILGDD